MADFFQHSNALVESSNVGEGTNIWAFAHVLPGAVIGKDCNICDHVFIENDVVVGDRVTVKCGVQLWDGLRVADDVFIGPNATFTNDIFPRSKQRPESYERTYLQRGASVGANATILAGKTIGYNAMVGAGAVVIRDVPPNAVVVGNPARISGYVSTTREKKPEPVSRAEQGQQGDIRNSAVAGVYSVQLPVIPDMRGSISVAEIGQFLPFTPERVFFVYDVPSREVRGEHAHKKLREFLISVKGACSVMVEDGHSREEFLLDSPGAALHIPPLTWRVHYKYSPDAVLLVLASEAYDPDDYIRDYDTFIERISTR